MRANILKLLIALIVLGGSLPLPSTASESPPSFLKLQINGAIHGGTVELVRTSLERAKGNHSGVIIELDTPGGLLQSTREIVKLFLGSTVPIIVYVAPGGARAGSAGTFITMAAHVAVMAPGTNIGAAHPITITGKDPEKDGGKHLAQKIENDTIAFIETIATQRGRNVEWAIKAVKESSSIPEKKALELGVIDLVARNYSDIFTQLDGKKIKIDDKEIALKTKNATVEDVKISLSLRVLNTLASPTVMYILILLVVLGFYIEFSNPGLLFPAGIALTALVLLMFASKAVPMTYLGLALMLLGTGLLIAEAYVTSFGLLTIAGTAAFFFGGMLLFDPVETDFRVPFSYLVGSAFGVLIIGLVIGYLLIRTRNLPNVAGREALVGKTALATEAIVDQDQFRVFVEGEYWNAVSSAPISVDKDESLRIEKVDGLILHVAKQEQNIGG